LGDDSTKWSRHSPLPPSEWFHESLTFFAESVKLLAQGEHPEALNSLQKTREGEIRDFFVLHGQQSAYFRYRGVTKSKIAQSVSKNVAPRMDPSIEREVFKRDKYCCRYCGIRVIPKKFLREYAEEIGVVNFPIGKTNATRHGVILGFQAVADHVHPYSEGGLTDLSNMVTSCWSCNYGKSNYTLADLELDDPRDRNPVGLPGWNGLTDVNV
jgi:hypothetical protein